MPARQRISIDGTWEFWPDPEKLLTPVTLVKEEASQVNVPGPWQADERFRAYTGIAWYRRTFDLPADLENQAVFLHFGAVDYFTEAWVNGEPVGTHEGGYLPFEFDVTASAVPGMNTVILCVADELIDFSEIPHGKQSWYGMISGPWQPVFLELRPRVHIQKLKITPHDQQIDVAVNIGYAKPTEPSALALHAAIQSPSGEVVFEDPVIPDILAAFETGSLEFSCQLPNPKLWDLDTPNLYTLRTRLVNHDGTTADELEEPFGFRSIMTRDGQILLNGRPVYLRAALDQDYYPDGFTTPPSQEFIEREFIKARDMGLNCLRIHIKVGDPRYYAAADRIGLLIWTELPNWNLLTGLARQRAHDTLLGMVDRDWNHPSIVIWTIINESWGLDLTNPEHRQWLRDMYLELKTADPTRLVVDNSACWGNFHVTTDLDDFHNYYAMPDHYDRWRDWVANFASRPWWTFAHNYGKASEWRDFLQDPWNAPARPHSDEVTRRGDEPLLVSEFGNWGLPDVQKLNAAYGTEPWWFETGLGFGDGVVYPHGVQQRFQEYHLDRAFGDLAGLARQSQWHQFAALKYQIEQIRLHPTIQGYVITEFTDVHWESNGLLDMQRQPKAHYQALGWLNHDNMIIPEVERFAYSSREKINIPVSLSHYAPAGEAVQSKIGLIPALLEWWVTYPRAEDAPTTIEGMVRGFSGPSGSVVKFGTITFQAPRVDHPTHVKLKLRWKDDAGTLMAHNEVDIFIFSLVPGPLLERPGAPVFLSDNIRRPALAKFLARAGYELANKPGPSTLILATTLTDEIRQHLLEGAKVLWLARSTRDLQTYISGIGLAARQNSAWQGDWASSMGWICHDRIFTDIPSEAAAGFMLKDLTPDHVLTGFSPREFASQVHAGLFVGWVHKPVATIAERQAGRGRLLACTFRLAENIGRNPAAGYMLNEMMNFLLQNEIH